MTTDLPLAGPEREILLRALRDYSEACRAPALTPGCPFAVDVSPGKRGCGEECVTLLAEYEAPPPVEEIVVAEFSFIRNRRPRPRRGPEGTRPFDAREIALEDEAKAPGNRRTAALLSVLRRNICDPPDFDDSSRRMHIEEACQELARRGLDVELLIRLGLGQQIATAIFLGVVMGPLVASLGKNDQAGIPDLPSTPEPWAERLLPGIDLNDAEASLGIIAEQLGAIAAESHPILTWAASAPVNDLINWTAPTSLPPGALPEAFSEAAPHRWVIDRFVITYYDDWETSSLLLEWQYLHGEALPPCPVGVFSVRRIAADEIAGIIADRSAKGERKKVATPLNRYIYAAVDLLMSGRRESAASLFEVVVRFEPTNAEAHNNFGFCLLPDYPSDALYHFERAAALGWAQHPFLLANRIHALTRLARFTTALELADQFLGLFGLTYRTFGWMWSLEDEPKLFEVHDIGQYARELICVIIERAGEPTLAATWSARLEESG